MQSVSARFLAALRKPHSISVRCRLYRPSAPTVAIDTHVIDGAVSSDLDARNLRSGSVDLSFALTDPVTVAVLRELPFGGYAVLERGIRYANGEIERVQLGRFRIEQVTWPDLQGIATLTLADRMAQISDEAFVTPYVPAGLKPSDAIVALVNAVFGSSIAYLVTTTPATETALADVVYDEDRAAAISDLASGIGADAFFNANGDFVLRPKPAIGSPVWTVDAGSSGVMMGSSESLDRSAVRNGVSVRAAPASDQPPIYSLATDSDPASPTRWGGPFGKVPLIVNSTSIATQAQADSTAANLLNLRLGLSRTLELIGVPNPALEAGDVIQIEHPDGRSELQIVNALRIGLSPGGELGLSTRAQWRPSLSLKSERPIRVLAGEQAWRETEEAIA